jgi:hypothetical protein
MNKWYKYEYMGFYSDFYAIVRLHELLKNLNGIAGGFIGLDIIMG